jgi:putative ABC transport system substrate-binding protein
VTELIAKKVELVVADGTQAVLAAKGVTSTVPIVAATSVDLVGVGAVASLAKPGGNITGLQFIADALAGKRLALLKEIAPRIRRVGVLVNPGNPGTLLQLKEAQAAAAGLALDVHSAAIRGPDDVDHAILSIVGRVDAILVTDDLLLDQHRARIGTLAVRNRLPSICGYRVPDDKLCLVWYGPDIMDLFRRAGTYVARILGGTSPADLPVEQPTKFTLIINARTASTLGIVVPQSLLTTADDIVR